MSNPLKTTSHCLKELICTHIKRFYRKIPGGKKTQLPKEKTLRDLGLILRSDHPLEVGMEIHSSILV